jgi:hypothetical protein
VAEVDGPLRRTAPQTGDRPLPSAIEELEIHLLETLYRMALRNRLFLSCPPALCRCDEHFQTAVRQQSRVLLIQVRLAPMVGCEVEVTLFNQQLLHARKHLHGKAVIQVRDQHADVKGLPLAQRTGIDAGPVVELGRCFRYTAAGPLGNGTDTGLVV